MTLGDTETVQRLLSLAGLGFGLDIGFLIECTEESDHADHIEEEKPPDPLREPTHTLTYIVQHHSCVGQHYVELRLCVSVTWMCDDVIQSACW